VILFAAPVGHSLRIKIGKTMTLSITRQFLRAGATALMLSTVASVATFVTADAAFAERGGNGNGNGNGRANRDNDRNNASVNRGQARQDARREIMDAAGVSNWGAIASELGELNKANANINARLNSSDPIHQALGAYEASGGISVDGIGAYNTAQTAYAAAQAAYEAALLTVGEPVIDPETDLPVLEADGVTPVVITADDIVPVGTFAEFSGLSAELIAAYDALAVLNGYRDDPLTRSAMDALNYMLDIDAPASE